MPLEAIIIAAAIFLIGVGLKVASLARQRRQPIEDRINRMERDRRRAGPPPARDA